MHFGMIGSDLTFTGLWAVPYLSDGLGLTRTSAITVLSKKARKCW